MLKKIEAYLPKNEQEEMDRALMLDFLRRHDDAYCNTDKAGDDGNLQRV